ncbi:bifunctional polysaccharide deacetylase/glycosyltransferase family 2 protein [Streptomyces sp. NPDC048565]|uniref:bifunctional polysaccharide deacetylase/glycosyltransferase family 2 protein n=1 Tax=Streptomyces sp. NPDC048565 TaxID=3155266 RepID=UPI00341ADE20
MAARHKQKREPRAHWLLLALSLALVAVVLVFHGWTKHEVDAARTRLTCDEPVPDGVNTTSPVLTKVRGDTAVSLPVPAGKVALTFNGGPDPVWTPRVLDLLSRHHAHATFFLSGADAAKYPGLVRQIRAEGHEIGSGTYTGAAMDDASSQRAGLELALTQATLAGSAGAHTDLLRMPRTTSVPTLCGDMWPAVRRASADGYTVVAASPWSKKAGTGVLRQYEQNAHGLGQAEALLKNKDKDVEEFDTVSVATGLGASERTATPWQQVRGQALLLSVRAGDRFLTIMGWLLVVAGGLGVLRLLMLVFFARVHVRRLERYRPGSPWLREIRDPVTVLVPAYNEEKGIESTLRSLLASTHRQLQIVVIDDGSSDRTATIAESVRDPRLNVVRQANAGKAEALNTGLRYARYNIVVMVDADTVLEPDAIRRLIQPLAHPAVGAVSGNTKVGNRRGLLGRWQHLEYCFGFNLDRRMFEVLECMITVPGAIGAFRRDAALGVGGVSTDTLAEDTDLTMALWRAGWRVVYEETAIAWTEVPTSLRQLWRQRYRWCFGTLQAARKHAGALREFGPAGRFARRGISYLLVFQMALPLLAPVIDVYALYGILFQDGSDAMAVWGGFLAAQMFCAGYALKLDGERLRSLWAMPFQLVVYRQLMYLVVIQSVAATVSGTRLKWQRMQRSGTAAQEIGGRPRARSLESR